jgi:hypothetical protein
VEGGKKGVVVHTCNPSHLGSRGRRTVSPRPAWATLQVPVKREG